MGFVEVHDENHVEAALAALRAGILVDADLSNIYSVRPENRKTAEAFHARADHRLVRERVFELLPKLPFSFYVVVRGKSGVLADVIADLYAAL